MGDLYIYEAPFVLKLVIIAVSKQQLQIYKHLVTPPTDLIYPASDK